jgi:hypothetical protein
MSLTNEERHIIRRAVEKMQRVYRGLQPAAQPGECWAEVEALEELLLSGEEEVAR